ncbi:unnamed protein product, partial [Rotaria socialis]
MSENKTSTYKKQPLLGLVPRLAVVSSQQRKQLPKEINVYSTAQTYNPVFENTASTPLEEILLKTKPKIETRVPSSIDNNYRKKTSKVSSLNSHEILTPKVIQQPNKSSSGCL